MFENIMNFFKKLSKKEGQNETKKNKDEAKERLHLVLMQDRANVSADFLDMMRQEIIDVIKKYIEVDEKEIDVTLTNKSNGDGTTGVPALYANIPIRSIKNDLVQNTNKVTKKDEDEAKENIKNKKEDDKENNEVEENKEDNENKTEGKKPVKKK